MKTCWWCNLSFALCVLKEVFGPFFKGLWAILGETVEGMAVLLAGVLMIGVAICCTIGIAYGIFKIRQHMSPQALEAFGVTIMLLVIVSAVGHIIWRTVWAFSRAIKKCKQVMV